MMEQSILDSVKKMIGIVPEDDSFDSDIIININSAFMDLNQIGVGPEKGFSISNNSEQWSDFTNNNMAIESVKTYVYLKTRIVFDPPQNSIVLNSMESRLKEIEWRLSVSNSFSGGDS